MLFIVDSTGRQIYNQSGAPRGDGLVRLLVKGIEQTGGYKEAAALTRDKRLSEIVVRARQMLARDETPAAVAILAPLLSETDAAGLDDNKAALAALGVTINADTGSGAQKELGKLANQIAEQGRAEIDRAVNNIESPDKRLVGAVKLIRAERFYGQLPLLQESLREAFAKLAGHADGRELLDQAKLIDKARQYEEKKSIRSTIRAYKTVIAAFPDTKAAQLCQLRIGQMSGELGARKSDVPAGPTPRRWTDKTGKRSVMAVLVRFDGQIALMRRDDGRVIPVPIDALSEGCQRYVRSRTSGG
jgi:hypothetical protein